jgi:hypothetical protein
MNDSNPPDDVAEGSITPHDASDHILTLLSQHVSNTLSAPLAPAIPVALAPVPYVPTSGAIPNVNLAPTVGITKLAFV